MLLLAAPGTRSIPRWDPSLGMGPLAFVPKAVSSLDIFLKFNSDFFVFSTQKIHGFQTESPVLGDRH